MVFDHKALYSIDPASSCQCGMYSFGAQFPSYQGVEGMQRAGYVAVAVAVVMDLLLALASFSDLNRIDGYLALSYRSRMAQAAWIWLPFECSL